STVNLASSACFARTRAFVSRARFAFAFAADTAADCARLRSSAGATRNTSLPDFSEHGRQYRTSESFVGRVDASTPGCKSFGHSHRTRFVLLVDVFFIIPLYHPSRRC